MCVMCGGVLCVGVCCGKGLPKQDVKNITTEERNQIFKEQYYDRIKGV